jgi:hypothetical protein
MSVRSSVVTALSGTGVPVYFQKWVGDSDPPARYFVYTSMTLPHQWQDDTLMSRKHYIYLNLYSETDYLDLVPTIRSGMSAAGFAPVDERDVSDNEYTQGSHNNYLLSMTWSYVEAV